MKADGMDELAMHPTADLLKPFPAEPMTMWPISTRVNSPRNDDADLLRPLEEADASWPRDGNSA